MEDGWIEWAGGECPVPAGTLVDVRLRDGDEFTELAGYGGKWALDWSNEDDDRDIIAYRIATQAVDAK